MLIILVVLMVMIIIATIMLEDSEICKKYDLYDKYNNGR